MNDVQRQKLNRLVLRGLADPNFRERLTARDDSGAHPILIFGLEDPMRSVLTGVREVGGSANVVVPYLNGIRVVAVEIVDGAPKP